MPRGRLIFPFLIDIMQLQTAATAADPDGAGPLTSGYDELFDEPELVAPAAPSSARGTIRRVEQLVQLKAQVEPERQNMLQMMTGGRSPATGIGLIFHYADLEAAGMVDSTTGRPKLRGPGDRLAAIRNYKTGELIEEFPASPGIYATEVQSLGFGLGPQRNLLRVMFRHRELSVVSAGG